MVQDINEMIMARAIKTSREALTIVLFDRELSIPWERTSKLLLNATEKQRMNAELAPSGYGIQGSFAPRTKEPDACSHFFKSFLRRWC